MARTLNVAEAKRRFSELLTRAAFAGERFVIARRGRPLAALVATRDLERLEHPPGGRAQPEGLLAAAKALADYPGLEAVTADIYRARRRSKGRRVTV